MSRRVIAIAVAASIVIAGLWFVAMWSPQSKTLHKANARVAAAITQQHTLQADIATLQQEKTQLPAKQAQLDKLKQALPDVPELDTLIDNINAAATASGVDWQNITPSKPLTYSASSGAAIASGLPSGMQSIQVGLQVNGLYPQLLDFVNRLNGMSRLLGVDSVNFSGVGGAVKTSVQIASQIFFVPPTGSVPATTSTTTGH